jgi:putative transferase (TIGR04331 family)
MKLHLVTTALEESWKSDKPVLFLGKWCRRWERCSVWSGMDAKVAPAYGLNPHEKRANVARVEALAAQLLDELVPVLNRYHSQAHGLRYWQIVLGHWLQRYVSVAYFRYFSVLRALENFPLAGTTTLRPINYSLVTNDSLAFIWATNDDLWNHVFFSRVIQSINIQDWEQEIVPYEGPHMFTVEEGGSPQGSMLRSVAEFVFESVLPLFVKWDDAFILNSYLPPKQEALLQFALGQIPQRWHTPKLPALPAPRQTKERLPGWNQSCCQGFDFFVRDLLPEVIPVCFLEGYKAIATSADTQNWPDQPKFIFTSNNFDTDEVFKVWAAGKAEAGTPYLTGQHGNNYGTHFFYGDHTWPERAAADGFLTWGWSDWRANTVPAFNFKTDPRKATECDSQGGLLLIETSATHKIMPWDVDAEHLEYIKQQFRFTDALPKGIKSTMVVRLHAATARFRHDEPAQWAARFPDLLLDNGATPLRKLVSRSRLVVHSYDSTGILEMLAMNLPCICFWPDGLNHLDDSALPYYQLLLESGVLQNSPEAAASKIESVWMDVNSWWGSAEVQKARLRFCDRYSIAEERPVATLRDLLTESANKFRRERSG